MSQMPGQVMKNLPHFAGIIAPALAGFATWFQTKIASDPVVIDTFGNLSSVPTWIAAAGTLITGALGLWATLSNQATSEKCVDVAAKAPPLAPPGVDQVAHTIASAGVQAVGLGRLDDAQTAFDALKKLKGAQ